jgi:glutathione S-transferase
MKLVIGNKNYSSWSLRAWLLLKHFDIAFDEIRIPLFTESTESALAQYSDSGLVPVLIDGDLNIWDSLAICEYVSENHVDGKGWPEATKVRAIARSACAEMHSGFNHIREYLPMNCRATKRITFTEPTNREIQRIDELWQSIKSDYGAKGDWLFGEFSIADCFFAPMALRFRTYQPELSSISLHYIKCITQHPSVQLWCKEASEEPETIQACEVGV